MAVIGMLPEDLEADCVVELWPENWLPVDLFRRLRGSWRVSASGPYGLDLNVAFALMDLMGVAHADRLEMLDALRALEQAALDEMNKGTP